MNGRQIKAKDFSTEFSFTASRSSGPGGQNVNKVSTKVELRFNVADSNLLTEDEKELIKAKLNKKINNENELVIVCQSERSQFRNKEKVIEKFILLMEKVLIPKIKRKTTKPSKAALKKRMESKRLQAEKKELRKKIN